MTQPTSTSYALLGPLNIRPWTAYEMVGQIRRSLRHWWPRSEAHLYAELKRLVVLGYADAERTTVGRRSRTRYSITDAGRHAMREWLRTPPQPPLLEFEGLLRVMYADQGEVADLLESLRLTREHAEQVLADGVRDAREVLAGGGNFPRRLHLAVLFSDFFSAYTRLVADWAERTAEVVATWDSAAERDPTPRERAALDAILDRDEIARRSPGEPVREEQVREKWR